VHADSKDVVLASSDWPVQFSAAEPQVCQSFENGEPTRQAQLHPVEERGQVSYTPFAAYFLARSACPSWLEPIQAFVLYRQAWPRHVGDGSVSSFEEGDNSRPDEIARWQLDSFDRGATDGTLELSPAGPQRLVLSSESIGCEVGCQPGFGAVGDSAVPPCESAWLATAWFLGGDQCLPVNFP
jgi:hypothetical protein